MENFKAINYHQTRDFSRKMSATFEYIRQNIKGLGKSILYIAGPPVLIASLLLGSFFGDFFSASFAAGRGGNDQAMQDFVMSPAFWVQMGLMFIFTIVSTVATIATIYNYMLLYEEKQSNIIEVSEVWDRVRQTFMMYLGTAVLFTLLGIVVYAVTIIPVVLLAAVSPVLIFFGVVALFCAITYLVVTTSLVFIIRAYERVGFFESIGRSFRLIQGKWWSTFGILFVLYLIAGTVSYIFIIPWYIMTIVSAIHNTGVEGFQEPGTAQEAMTIVFFTLYYLAQMILYSLPSVGLAFQYFNLVERKEARGLMSQIETIGQAPSATTSGDEHY